MRPKFLSTQAKVAAFTNEALLGLAQRDTTYRSEKILGAAYRVTTKYFVFAGAPQVRSFIQEKLAFERAGSGLGLEFLHFPQESDGCRVGSFYAIARIDNVKPPLRVPRLRSLHTLGCVAAEPLIRARMAGLGCSADDVERVVRELRNQSPDAPITT